MSNGRHIGRTSGLVTPHGGKLVDLMADPARVALIKTVARDLVSIDLTCRQMADLEMLATGVFSPLESFMGKADYESVCAQLRLADGKLWPLPVTLEVSAKTAEKISMGQIMALRDAEGALVAVMTVSEIWKPDRLLEAQNVYATQLPSHPEVSHLLHIKEDVCITGKLEVVELPIHYDFVSRRLTPAQVRAQFLKQGTHRVIGYQPRALMHRAHVEFSKSAAYTNDAALLIQASVGRRDHGDVDHFSRTRALLAAMDQYAMPIATLNVLELSPRFAGVRSALWHALIQKNFGCSHFILEHDYDDHGAQATGQPCYGQYQGLEALVRYSTEIGLQVLPFRNLVLEEDQPEKLLLPRGANRRMKGRNRSVTPEQKAEVAHWFSYPSVLEEWHKSLRHGLTLFFTGLSGAGKSTLAQIVYARLKEREAHPVTLLDGDVVRKNISSELGFSREHRDINVLRQGYVASLITRHGGIAICAPIAPYANTRAKVRAMVEDVGDFVEIYVSTPLATCESRDRKGLYARARMGMIKQFTGVSDPYEIPAQPELEIDTSQLSTEAAVDHILAFLAEHGYMTETRSSTAYQTAPKEHVELKIPTAVASEMPLAFAASVLEGPSTGKPIQK